MRGENGWEGRGGEGKGRREGSGDGGMMISYVRGAKRVLNIIRVSEK